MARYTYIPNRVIDTNGISDGANIYFYATGTTTPVTVYSDAALTTPVSNPYPVSAGAAVPALYYAEDDVRVRVVDSGGNVVSDDDPWSAIEPDAIYLDTGDDVQSALNGYATRAAIKALTSYSGARVYLTESGREGSFVFRTGNYATQITADTLEGQYLKADDTAASAGAWVREGATDTYDARHFGWTEAGDIASYLANFRDGPWSKFYLPPQATYTLGSTVVFDMGVVTTRYKILELYGTTRSSTTALAEIEVTSSVTAGLEPFFIVRGGDTYLSQSADRGFYVHDVRNVRFYSHFVWGDSTKATSRGTGWFVENKKTYTERVVWIGCGAPYCQHDIHWNLEGAENGGGLSFARMVVQDFNVNAGVSAQAKFKLSTEVTSIGGITSASDYTYGEVVSQASSGATGTWRGYTEAETEGFIAVTSGTFDTSGAIVGASSSTSKTPSSVTVNRLPNIYDSSFDGIRGNISTGAIMMQLGGGMVGTTLRDFQLEAPSTAYVFEDLGNWTTERPNLYGIDLANNMSLFSASRAAKSFNALPLYDGVRFVPSEVSPDTAEGVIAVADGSGWNPASVGTGDGGKGLFARLFSGWRRMIYYDQASDADLRNSGATINTSGKYLGKPVFNSTFSRWMTTAAASAAQPWTFMSDPPSGATGSRPTTTVVGSMYFDTTLGKPIWRDNNGTTGWCDATGAAV